jgi:hypothetical protein
VPGEGREPERPGRRTILDQTTNNSNGDFYFPQQMLERSVREAVEGKRAIYFPPNRCDELAALLVREWLDILPGLFDYDT